MRRSLSWRSTRLAIVVWCVLAGGLLFAKRTGVGIQRTGNQDMHVAVDRRPHAVRDRESTWDLGRRL